MSTIVHQKTDDYLNKAEKMLKQKKFKQGETMLKIADAYIQGALDQNQDILNEAKTGGKNNVRNVHI